jgi:hypothetical protein
MLTLIYLPELLWHVLRLHRLHHYDYSYHYQQTLPDGTLCYMWGTLGNGWSCSCGERWVLT